MTGMTPLQKQMREAAACTLCGWAKPWHAARCLVWKAYDAIHAPNKDSGSEETPDPPEAPIWLGHEEAGAWQGGWTAGYEAARTF